MRGSVKLPDEWWDRENTLSGDKPFGNGLGGEGEGENGERSCVYPQRHNNIRCNRIINRQQRLVIAVAGFVVVHWSNNTSED